MSWQDFYRTVVTRFGMKGPFYGPAGHRGADYAAAPHQTIPAYFTGTCVKNGHSDVLGNYTVYKVGTNDYRGFAHLQIGSRQTVGTRVTKGQSIGKAAARGDDHGSAWSGPHCHTTKSDSIDGIVSGNVFNPVPSISASIRSSTTPVATPSSAVFHTVRSGDTLGKIASHYGTTVPRILALPQSPRITNPDIITVGQRIRVK